MKSVAQNRNYLEKTIFEKQEDVKSVRRYGKYYSKLPQVTIIMPTYKRGDRIYNALMSAINQEGFDDYQILIVDNEDNCEEMNQTEETIRKIASDKVIYYRNEKNIGMYGNWNRCLQLAKTEWVCMLHDDDVITKQHLFIMMGIINKCQQIDYLGCRLKMLNKRRGTYKIENELNVKRIKKSYRIYSINYKDYNLGFGETLFLGSVFRRKKAISIGGFEIEKTCIEDYFFCVKFSKYFKLFFLDEQLYKHIDEDNCTMNINIYQTALIDEYYLYRQISKTRNFVLRPLYLYASKVKILEYAKNLLNGNLIGKKARIDINKLKEDCGMKKFYNFESVWWVIEKVISFNKIVYDKTVRKSLYIKLERR